MGGRVRLWASDLLCHQLRGAAALRAWARAAFHGVQV